MTTDSELSAVVAEPVAAWLQPLDGAACGEDLEYDPAFTELAQTAAGKPETQFAPAEQPVWPLVREQSQALMERTRDLRVALLWARASVNTDGLPGLLPSLQLLTGLLDTFWDQGLHPALDPDDGDAFARINVLGSLDSLEGLLGDVRQALVMRDRRLDGLRVREVEVALDRLPARTGESVRSVPQLQNQFAELPDLADAVRSNTAQCLQTLKQLQKVMNDRFGMGEAVDVKALRLMLDAIKTVVPESAADAADDGADDGDGGDDDADSNGGTGGSAGGRGGGTGGAAGKRNSSGGPPTRIDTRKDAIRAIQLVCEFLERAEPTNPAQLLLRRAERLIEKNFLQLVRELAPDAMSEVARIMGVDPDSLSDDD